MMQDAMEYQPVDRRDDEGRERVSATEFERRVWRAATHLAVGVALVNRDPEQAEADFDFSLEEYTARLRRDAVETEPLEQLSEEEREAVERLRAEFAQSLSVTLARRFEIVPGLRRAGATFDL